MGRVQTLALLPLLQAIPQSHPCSLAGHLLRPPLAICSSFQGTTQTSSQSLPHQPFPLSQEPTTIDVPWELSSHHGQKSLSSKLFLFFTRNPQARSQLLSKLLPMAFPPSLPHSQLRSRLLPMAFPPSLPSFPGH